MFWGHFGDELADEGVGDVGHVFEADAAFAHVQFAFGVFGVFCGEPVEELGIGIDAHVVEGYEIFLGGDAEEWQWLCGIAVITGGVECVRYGPAEHAVAHAFGEAFGEIFGDGFVELVHWFYTLFGQGAQVF